MGAELGRPAAVALAGAAALAWLGLTGFAWNDYDLLAAGAVRALRDGDLATFLATAPAEGPSLLLRAPFALAPGLWGGGEDAAYRLLALPCLLAGVVLAVALARRRAALLPGARWGALVVLLVAANPITLRALDVGHPEELLAGALGVGAVLAAGRDRAVLAALLLGLCVATKLWGVVVAGPVLLALGRRHVAVLLGAGAVAGLVLAPFLLAEPAAGHVGLASAARTTGVEMQPWQLWWLTGGTDVVVRGFDGLVKPGFRTLHPGLVHLTHPAVVLAALGLAVAAWRRGCRDALLLLALVLLVRCLLDPYDNAYYHLPFLLALTAWEATRHARPPVLALGATVLVWLTTVRLPLVLGPDAQAAVYLVWALPAAAVLAAVVLRLPLPRRAPAPAPVAV